MEIIRVKDFRSYKFTDEEIVRRVVAGEKELFEILLRRYNQRLFRVIRAYLSPQEEIEDVMQETYMLAFEKLGQFRGDASFSTWLIRIGINEALRRIRDIQKQYKQKVDSDIGNPSFRHLPNPQTHDPEQKAIQAESRKLLEHAIDQLAEKYKTVYILREIEGFSTKEVAECLDISESNVKVRVFRAKALLKASLFRMMDVKGAFEFGNAQCDRIVDIVMHKVSEKYP